MSRLSIIVFAFVAALIVAPAKAQDHDLGWPPKAQLSQPGGIREGTKQSLKKRKADEAEIKRKVEKAMVDFFRRRAEQGDPEAQYSLGNVYFRGDGVPKDYGEAMNWFRRAADQGRADAQNNLGVGYEHGYGVPQNDREAVEWYRRGAAQGNATAQRNLCRMYYNGKGVAQDYRLAAEWSRRAAEQDDAPSQYVLGMLYAAGHGVPQDDVQAHLWLNLAAAQGNEDARDWRDRIASRMTANQLAQAQQLATAWRPKGTTETPEAPSPASVTTTRWFTSMFGHHTWLAFAALIAFPLSIIVLARAVSWVRAGFLADQDIRKIEEPIHQNMASVGRAHVAKVSGNMQGGASAAIDINLDDTIFLNEQAARESVTLVGPRRSVAVNSAILTMLLVIAKQKGWHGGDELFDIKGQTLGLKRFSRGLTVDGDEAFSLGATLRRTMDRQLQQSDSAELAIARKLIGFFLEGGFRIEA